mmetsp:Transcript_18682/g.38994  ORF Transcript_18682/g.38994 Transcript_18682/m.38994 type:complete len:272 (+) Transcript_18682:497-1312(+)
MTPMLRIARPRQPPGEGTASTRRKTTATTTTTDAPPPRLSDSTGLSPAAPRTWPRGRSTIVVSPGSGTIAASGQMPRRTMTPAARGTKGDSSDSCGRNAVSSSTPSKGMAIASFGPFPCRCTETKTCTGRRGSGYWISWRGRKITFEISWWRTTTRRKTTTTTTTASTNRESAPSAPPSSSATPSSEEECSAPRSAPRSARCSAHRSAPRSARRSPPPSAPRWASRSSTERRSASRSAPRSDSPSEADSPPRNCPRRSPARGSSRGGPTKR